MNTKTFSDILNECYVTIRERLAMAVRDDLTGLQHQYQGALDEIKHLRLMWKIWNE